MQIQMQMQMQKQQIKVIQNYLYKKCALQKVSSKSCETIPLINKTFVLLMPMSMPMPMPIAYVKKRWV